MDQRRAILIVLAFFQVLLAARVLMGAVIEFQTQELNRKRRRIIKKRSREDNELAMAGIFAAIQKKRIRRFWVDARSNHWITRVLDGMLLRAAEFDNIFRMSRNSFNLLHGLLGIPA